MARPDPNRLLNPDGFRHFRKRYARAELRWGGAVLVALASVFVWVGWKGAHPDPELLESDAFLLLSSNTLAGNKPQERGPLPPGLATEGWLEGAIAHFDKDNLYEKINGREGFYKSFGFERLTFVSLVRADNPKQAVDIELFTMSDAAAALGCYSAERQPTARPTRYADGVWHRSRNSLFLTNGRFYARAIGSDESKSIAALLAHLRQRLSTATRGAELPWGYAFLMQETHAPIDAIAYHRESAFSFDVGTDVYSARTGPANTEIFVTFRAPDTAAEKDANAFMKGFLDFGQSIDGGLVRHTYLNEYATVSHDGPWVFGVRQAPDPGAAIEALKNLKQALQEAASSWRERAEQASQRLANEDGEQAMTSEKPKPWGLLPPRGRAIPNSPRRRSDGSEGERNRDGATTGRRSHPRR
jgi:hypothetical protein